MSLNLSKKKTLLLDQILSKVGDLNFCRRIIQMLEYLNIKKGEVILDMGCGEGFYSMLISNLYDCSIFAIDNDRKILGQAERWLAGNTKVEFGRGDICKLNFYDNTFDKIICTEVLEHIPDDSRAVKELLRVLKPGGILAATVPNSNFPFAWDPLNKILGWLHLGHFNPKNEFFGGIWSYDHKRLYSPDDLSGLLDDNGFKVEDVKVLTHYGVPFNHLVLYLGKSLYTKLPVSAEVKNSMEKFKWDEEGKAKNGSIFSYLINLVFFLIKKVDSLNNREFSLETSSMAVAAKAVKR